MYSGSAVLAEIRGRPSEQPISPTYLPRLSVGVLRILNYSPDLKYDVILYKDLGGGKARLERAPTGSQPAMLPLQHIPHIGLPFRSRT